jgi:DHA2 family methylenomycin A resistance protein-like MFS transporter
VDLGGQVLAVAGLGVLTAALVGAGRRGWASPVVLAGFVLSAAAWAAFAAVEHRGTDPMLPLPLFARRGFRTGTLVGFLINLGFYGQLFVMSLYFQDVRGYSALQTGLALLPEAALLTVASAVSGRVMARAGGVLGVAVLGSLVPVSPAFAGGMRIGLVIAACAFLAGAALVSGLAREPG